LREAHAMRVDTFQGFVDWLRAQPTHPLRATAVNFNRAVYEMQNAPFKSGWMRYQHKQA